MCVCTCRTEEEGGEKGRERGGEKGGEKGGERGGERGGVRADSDPEKSIQDPASRDQVVRGGVGVK